MATVMEKIGRPSLHQVRRVPQTFGEVMARMPDTLSDTEVPHFFRERYVHSGYRPLHRNWQYYFGSLLRCHNETINVWTHLLGALMVLTRTAQLTETVDFINDPHSWALLILLLSSVAYMTFSALAHLLAAKSEVCHYAFFFLDYVGVAMYQYGSAVAHYYYAIEESWHEQVKGLFMPVASLLCCLSCFCCCYGTYWNYSLPHGVWKVSKVVPSAIAYIWDSSPVFHRISLWLLSLTWSESRSTSALIFHFGQVVFFLSSVFFFAHPLPQCWFPGHCDFLGQGHQIFHVLLVLCTLCQIQASYLDYLNRQIIYSHFHTDREPLLFLYLYVLTSVTCALIAMYILASVKTLLRDKTK